MVNSYEDFRGYMLLNNECEALKELYEIGKACNWHYRTSDLKNKSIKEIDIYRGWSSVTNKLGLPFSGIDTIEDLMTNMVDNLALIIPGVISLIEKRESLCDLVKDENVKDLLTKILKTGKDSYSIIYDKLIDNPKVHCSMKEDVKELVKNKDYFYILNELLGKDRFTDLLKKELREVKPNYSLLDASDDNYYFKETDNLLIKNFKSSVYLNNYLMNKKYFDYKNLFEYIKEEWLLHDLSFLHDNQFYFEVKDGHLMRLKLREVTLKEIPEQLLQFSNIKSLDLSKNEFSNINRLNELKELKSLYLNFTFVMDVTPLINTGLKELWMCNVISEEEALEIKKKNAVLIEKQEKSDDEHDPSLYNDPREYSCLHDSKLLIKGLDKLTQLDKLVIREELAEKNQESLKVLKDKGVKVDIRRFSF